MAELLKGVPAAAAINARSAADIEMLKEKGIEPCLAIVQLGSNDADTAYANDQSRDSVHCHNIFYLSVLYLFSSSQLLDIRWRIGFGVLGHMGGYLRWNRHQTLEICASSLSPRAWELK